MDTRSSVVLTPQLETQILSLNDAVLSMSVQSDDVTAKIRAT